MSNLNEEKDYSNMTDALQFVFNQLLKTIFVSIPGIIESYDASKKRCRVKPAINILRTDGKTTAQSSIVNVPVIWPGGGGYTLISPLPAGTPVEIKFSQRGITKFKETFLQEDPGNGIFDKEDAHVIPGYGALSIAPGSLTGLCLQKEDGSIFICIEDNKVKIKGDLEMIDGVITGPAVFGSGGPSSIDHKHSQGNDSDGDTEVDTGGAHS